jgi:hypothetical protein
MKSFIILSFLTFIITSFDVTASATPTVCETKFEENNLEQDSYLCTRYSWSSKKIAKIKWKDYFTCRQNTLNLIIPNKKAKHVCTYKAENKWLKSSQFVNCTDSLQGHVATNDLYNKCQTTMNANTYSSQSFNRCMTEIPQYLGDSKSAFSRCDDWNFRSAFKKTNFHQCVHKMDKVYSKRDALKICIKSQDQLDYITSSKFDKCLSKAKSFKQKDAYLLCTTERFIDEVEDTDMRSCLMSGFQAASLNYYLYKHLEVQKDSSKRPKHEFHYLFRDCNAENSFFSFDKEPVVKNKYINYHSDYNIHSSTRFQNNFLLGGLSALRFNTDESSLTFLSDDRGTYGPARLIKYDYQFNKKNHFTFTENSIIKLTSSVSEKLQMDPEGFDVLNNGDLIISSELDNLEGDDFISIYNKNGNKLDTISLHEDFKPKSESRKKCEVKTGFFFNSKTKTCKVFTTEKGFQPNKSLESLSLSPNKQYLFTANEQALHQDKRFKKSWGFKKKIVDHVRIVKFNKNSDNKFVEFAQYYYQLESEIDNGLVDILALNENKILTLERSWNSVKKKITARIYFVDLTSGEDIMSSNDYKAKPVDKKLLLDLSDIQGQLAPGFRLLDNFEGMAFGPILPNGKQSLVLVTDNNFKSYQRSLLLFLEINLININK